jgi:(S)-2-hydroxy-acid oxidase
MSLEDAIMAAKYNVDAIWISNHGGRQLDGVSSTLELLPYISQAVKCSIRLI